MPAVIKAVFALLVTLAVPVLAADYDMPRGVLAQVSVSGGFKPIDAPYATGVRIRQNGHVESFSISNDGKTETRLLAVLTPQRTAAIAAEPRKLTVVKLVQADPNAPPCADAPETVYLARNSRLEVVPLKGTINCNKYLRADGAWSDLPAILDGFLTLSYLK